MGTRGITTQESIRLAAIVFTDIVGFSAIVHRDPVLGKQLLDRHRHVIRDALIRFGGREIETAGDSFLLVFESMQAAFAFTVAIQQRLAQDNAAQPADGQVLVRAGIHLGDIEHRGAEIYGDGVNTSARILPFAPPGGLALSDVAWRQVRHRLGGQGRSIGSPALKNIEQPIELFVIEPELLLALDMGDVAASAEFVEPTWRLRGSTAGQIVLRWRFENVRFDERSLELQVGDQLVPLERTSLEVLQYLLWHAGEVVTPVELLDAVWSGRLLGDDVVAASVDRLSDAIGDTSRAIIRTVPGYGYRLAVPVSVERANESDKGAEQRFDFAFGQAVPLRPQWKLIERLGTGSSGEAWLAEHEKTHERRAYKFAVDDRALVSLKREITLYRLLHDALGARSDIVRIIDWNVAEAPFFTEAEYATGGNLDAWAQQRGGIGTLPMALRLGLLAQIAQTLAAAHSVGVLHKDLKPANVLVDDRDSTAPVTRLADFGSGAVMDAGRLDQLGITRMGLTLPPADGSTVGTTMYLAPEVLAGQPATVQADIYALGVMLYQLVIGDFRKALAPGWEQDVDDELLREDIALAAAGNPQRRVGDAAEIARRLAALDERRARRQQDREQAEANRIAALKAEEARHENARLRARRTGLIAAMAVLVLGMAGTTGMYLRASKAQKQAQQNAADAEAMSDFLTKDVLNAVDPSKHDTRELAGVKALLDSGVSKIDERFKGRLIAATRLRVRLANAYASIGLNSSALSLFQRVRDDAEEALKSRRADAVEIGWVAIDGRALAASKGDPEFPLAFSELANRQWQEDDTRKWVLHNIAGSVALTRGDDARALQEFEASLTSASQLPSTSWSSPELDALDSLAGYQYLLGHHDQVLVICRKERDLADRTAGTTSGRSMFALDCAADVLMRRGEYADAEKQLEDALRLSTSTRGPENIHVIRQKIMSATLLAMQGHPAEALTYSEPELKRYQQSLITGDSWLAWMNDMLAEQYTLASENDKAIAALHTAITIYEELHDIDSTPIDGDRVLLAQLLASPQRVNEAEAELAKISTTNRRNLERWRLYRGELRRAEGLIALARGDKSKAIAALTDALDNNTQVFGPTGYKTLQARADLARLTTP